MLGARGARGALCLTFFGVSVGVGRIVGILVARQFGSLGCVAASPSFVSLVSVLVSLSYAVVRSLSLVYVVFSLFLLLFLDNATWMIGLILTIGVRKIPIYLSRERSSAN